MSGGHVPVMLDEVLEAIEPLDGRHYIDGTFGGGGYTRALLQRAGCRVLAIDRDPEAIARAEMLAKGYAGRLMVAQGNFSEMDSLLSEFDETQADGVMLDLGISSYQVDAPERGFSFRDDGALDMRMSKRGPSAADLVNTADEKTLADVIWRYGEERHSRRIAHAIVVARPLIRTRELADVIAKAMDPAAARQPIHPATRTFQALRIYVNDELGELERGLAAAERVLKAGGRLAVVAFHSLEDRMVKRFLTERSRPASASRHAPGAKSTSPQTFRLLWAGARMPASPEIARNPRARSARLRAAERTALAA